MNLSKEAQVKLDAITPKMSFVNCVAAISREAMYLKDYDQFRQTLNAMSHPEQQKLADEWETQGFASSKAFLEWLRQQPYFLETRQIMKTVDGLQNCLILRH